MASGQEVAPRQDEATIQDSAQESRPSDIQKEHIQRILDEGISSLNLSVCGEEVRNTEPCGNDQNDPDAEIEPTKVEKQLKNEIPPIEWVDITKEFQTAAAQLDHGELVNDAHFSLFDAMSAIELGDPKMDGMVQWKRFPNYPWTLKEALNRGCIQVDGHSVRTLIGIFDELLACLATWLEGHTLAQTIFTCLYLLDVSIIENIFLRAYSMATVKVTEFIRKAIFQGWVYGEEDQQAVCLGLNMLPAVSDTAVASALKEARDKAASLIKSKGNQNSSQSEGGVEQQRLETEALLTRIKFMRSFFGLTTSIEKMNCEGILVAQQELSNCISLIDGISSTLQLGEPLDKEDPISLGFHPLINQQILPPSCTLYAILPRAESLKFLKKVLQQTHQVFNIGRIDNFQELFQAIIKICSVESPNVLVRSLVVQLCVKGEREKLFGTRSLMALIREDVRSMYSPPSLNPKSPIFSDDKVKQTVDQFFMQALSYVTNLLHIYCQHRARQRTEIGKYLRTLGDLQREAEALDQVMHLLMCKFEPQRQHLACYSTWLVYFVGHLFVDYINLGFEYNLFSPHENHYVFWYLEYAYGWQQTALKMAGKLLKQEAQQSSKNRKKGKSRKRELPKEKELELSLIHVKRLMCVGLMRTYEALLLSNKITRPSFELASEKLAFNNRFFPFMSIITPHPLSYDDYQRLAGIDNYRGKNVNLYEAAAQHFQSAKIAIETIPYMAECESMLKVIKTNLVIMNLAARGHKRESKTPPILDFTVHKYFPIIRLN